MNAIPRNASRSDIFGSFCSAAQWVALTALPSAAMLFASGAHAQSAGCTQFKDKLAARIDPSIGGFALDIVPSKAVVPAGAKVFGTCDGGAYKILFRRGGSTRPTPGNAGEAASAPAPAPAPAPKPAPVAAPVPPPAPAPAPVVVAAAPPPAAPPPAAEPEKPVVVQAKDAEPVRTLDRVEATPTVAPADKASAMESAPEQGSPGSAWRWLWALLALPLVAWLWAWVAHRRAYDEAGLPRGPKITL